MPRNGAEHWRAGDSANALSSITMRAPQACVGFAQHAPSLKLTALAVAFSLMGAGAASAQSPIATAPPAPPPPSAAAQTSADDVIGLQADRIVTDEKAGQIIAEGGVEVRHKGRLLRASKIVYDMNTRRIRASGGVQITDPDGLVRSAEEMDLDETLEAGVASGFGAAFPGGGTAAASGAIRRADGRNELRDAIYTACPICKPGEGERPTWTLSARRAIQDPNTKMIEYRDAVLQFRDVPILYLPYFAHPDPTAGPRSGFLPPDLGQNRRLGAFYEQPYYLRIGPDQDLTISPRLHTQVNPLLGLEYRKRFWSGQVELAGSITNERDFDGAGERFGDRAWRGHLFGTGRFKINEFWDWGFGVERASDDLFLRRYDIPGAGQLRGPFAGDSLRLLSQAYLIGQDPNTYANVSLVAFQGLRETDDTTTLPLILPFIEFEHILKDPLLAGQLRLQASSASLVREENAVDSIRGSIGFDWRRDDVIGPGLVVGSFAQARTDRYRVSNRTPGKTEDFSRNVGLVGLELRYPMVRRDPGATLMVEPILTAVYGSNGGNDARIVNEDSLSFELDDSNLFRPNAAPNYDVWEPGARISAGVRASLRTDAGGSASFAFGRRWRDKADPIFGVSTNLDGTESDYVGVVSADLGPSFGARVRFRLDDESYDLTRIDAAVRAAVGAVSADVRYFDIDDALRPGAPSQEIRGNLAWKFDRNWTVGVGVQRDLDSDITLSQNVRLLYEDDCTFLEFSYARSETTDRRLGPNEGFQIRIGLSTLGVFGGS
jgi:LPS-assembly protein